MLLIPTIFAGSMGMNAIIEGQNVWYVLIAPLAAVIFLIAAIAELGRAPFDMAEGESELVSGFNIEYSGMKFGMFYAGELLHAFTFGGFLAILFFGGYRFFGLEQVSPFLAAAVLIFKATTHCAVPWVAAAPASPARFTMGRIGLRSF